MKDLRCSWICNSILAEKISYEKQKENRTLPQKSSSPTPVFRAGFFILVGCLLLVVGCWLRIKPVETDDQSMNCLNGVILLGLGFKVWGFGRFLKGLRILKILK